MNRIKTGIKLQVTPEQSEAVQKICFANGIFFNVANDKISYTEAEYLFIEHDRIWYRGYSDHNTGAQTKGYTEVDASFFIKTQGTCVEETPEQELEQNKNKEETMENNETESYKDVKEYLVAKGLYDRVMEIEWDVDDKCESFSGLFVWSKTTEGTFYWAGINKDLITLNISTNIDSLVQDYKAIQGKEFIQYLKTQPKEVVEEAPEQSTEAKPKQYLVFVPTKGKPKHIHQSLESAQEEAKRLCKSGLCEVMVLEVVSKYQAKVIVEEI